FSLITPDSHFSRPPRLISSSSSSITTTRPPLPANSSPAPLPLITTTGFASSIIPLTRSLGHLLSNGRYAPPAFNTPSKTITISADLGRQTPTTRSGPTP